MKTIIIGDFDERFFSNFDIDVCNDLKGSPYLPSYDCIIIQLEYCFAQYYNKDYRPEMFFEESKQIREAINKGKKIIIVNPIKKYRSSIRIIGSGMLSIESFLRSMLSFDYKISYVNGKFLTPVESSEFANKISKFLFEPIYEINRFDISYATIKDTEKTIIASLSKDSFVLCVPQIIPNKLWDFLSLIFETKTLPLLKENNLVFPEWSKNIRLLNEDDLLEAINLKTEEINNITQELNTCKEKLDRLNYIKSVLFSQDDYLENVVETILNEIGIFVEKSEVNNRVDRKIYLDPKEKCVVEIKGRLRKSAKESDCAQLEKWKMEGMQELGYEPKGILIMNAYAETEILKRHEYFPNQLLPFAEKKELSLVTSECLLDLYIDFKNEKISKEEVFNLISGTTGVMIYKKK